MVDCKLRTAGTTITEVTNAVGIVADVKTPGYEPEHLKTNPSAPNPPWDFPVIDFAVLENQAQRIKEATDNWVAAEEPEPAWIWKTIPSTRRQMDIDEW